jgi:arylformamidase
MVPMPRLIDVSVRLGDGLPTWPGSSGFGARRVRSIAGGDTANVTEIGMDVHSGTHVEGPLHFLADGASLDSLPLETFLGPVWVDEVSADSDAVTASLLASLEIPDPADRLLLRTRNSGLWESSGGEFRPDYVGLTPDAAHWIADRGMQLVGVDYLSVQRYVDGPETHRTLLRAGVAILEGLNLSGVERGWYTLICLPLRLTGTEASPVRAVLIDEDVERAADAS